ncbi:hypothetical protein GCM10027162_33100 [Streptomyces incanus]
MTVTRTTTLLGVAAEAALAVPGVAGLHPRLAAATAPTRTDTTPHRTSPEAGIRADRALDGPGGNIEVRCVLAEGRRALDIARNVHDRVGGRRHLPPRRPRCRGAGHRRGHGDPYRRPARRGMSSEGAVTLWSV